MKNTNHKITYEFSVEGTRDEIIEIRQSLTRQSQISGKIKQRTNDNYTIRQDGIPPFEIAVNLKSKPCKIIIRLTLGNFTPKIIRLTHGVLSKRLGKAFFEKLLNESNFHGATAKLNTDIDIQNSLTFLESDEKIYGNIDGLFKNVASGNIIKKAKTVLHAYNHANKTRRLSITAACTPKSHVTHAHFSNNHIHMEQLTIVCAELISEKTFNKGERSTHDHGLPLRQVALLEKRGINYGNRVEIDLTIPVLPSWRAFIKYCSSQLKDEKEKLAEKKTINTKLK